MQERFMAKSAGDRTRRRAVRMVGAALLALATAGAGHAGPLDQAVDSFSKKLSEGASRRANTDPQGTQKNTLPFAENTRKGAGSPPQADPQDYSTHQVPIGTRVRINNTLLERVLPQPTLSAQPVDACIDIVRTGGGTDTGMVVVKGYTSSQENPMAMRSVTHGNLNLADEPPFQAFWAQVQHVPIKTNNDRQRDFDAGTCRGWVRIDHRDSYHLGTGPYSTSLLRSWQAFAVTEAPSDGAPGNGLASGRRTVVNQSGWLMREPRLGTNYCKLFPGDELMVLEGPTGKDLYKVRLEKMRGCRGIELGFVQGRLIQSAH